LYMAEKDNHDGRPWTTWEEPIRNREEEALTKAREKLAEKIQFYAFQQYMFLKQWSKLHQYANANNIEIIGDIPIYVAFDSADTWADPKLFQFNEMNEPIAVAGCPPDRFSVNGQLWGNPLYRWEYHKKTGYQWWTARIAYSLKLYDILRVDHFRGFDEYYAIPFGAATARFGQWKQGPGIAFFNTLREKLDNMKMIAEDLGYLTDSVRQLVKDTGFPGMKVLEFAFDSREESDYLPHSYEKNCVVYTGTHDNDTIQGWYDTMNEHDREFAVRYMHNDRTPRNELHLDFVRMAMSSVADLCIIPIQDYLGLGGEARINVPSTIGTNWKWRLQKNQMNDNLITEMREMTKLYGRL
jgi:4-alpha-glucanotransferase